MRTITIGDRPLKNITSKHLSGLIEVMDFGYDQTLYDPVFVFNIEYRDAICMIKADYRAESRTNKKSTDTVSFFFHYERMSAGVRYSDNGRVPKLERLGLEALDYLISMGYDIPLGKRATNTQDDLDPRIIDHVGMIKGEPSYPKDRERLDKLIKETEWFFKDFRKKYGFAFIPGKGKSATMPEQDT